MGRRIPYDGNVLIQPALSLSTLAAGIAATIAITALLCGARSRKKPSSTRLDISSNTYNAMKNPTMSPSEIEDPPPPNPPKTNQFKESYSSSHDRVSKSQSSRNLASNLSMRLPRSLSHAKFGDRKGKLKTHDSIWTKTIILGEKCRVSENEEDAIIYDEKGVKISAYHPKTPRSLPISRSNSWIDPESVRSVERVKKIVEECDENR